MVSANVFQNRLQKAAETIQTNRYIKAITDSLVAAMPITMVGAAGSLINVMPMPAYQEYLVSSGLKTITQIPAEISSNLLSIYIVFLIGANFAKSFDIDGTPSGLLSLMSFFIVTPFNYSDTGTMLSYTTKWFGATGLFTAFLIALLSAKIYTLFVTKGWVIKMPSGVPPTVSKSFSGLIPGFAIAFIALIIRLLTSFTPFGDIHILIFRSIATPLIYLGGSFPAMVIAIFAAHILWLCGVHGTMVSYSVFAAIWTPLTAANVVANNAGEPIPNIISLTLFIMVFFMGSGGTLGLTLAMLRARSQQYRTLGKLAFIPNLCGINEPVIFGTPVVMNLKLAIPFIGMPMIVLFCAYFGMLSGLLPLLPGILAPLGVPAIVSGLLMGGWKWAVFQAAMIVISYCVYKPFFYYEDKAAYVKELAAKRKRYS